MYVVRTVILSFISLGLDGEAKHKGGENVLTFRMFLGNPPTARISKRKRSPGKAQSCHNSIEVLNFNFLDDFNGVSFGKSTVSETWTTKSAL